MRHFASVSVSQCQCVNVYSSGRQRVDSLGCQFVCVCVSLRQSQCQLTMRESDNRAAPKQIQRPRTMSGILGYNTTQRNHIEHNHSYRRR